jgi:hypothetical protein
MPGFSNSPRTLPIITDQRQLREYLNRWRSTLNRLIRSATPPPPPFNFQATGIRGAIQLSWAPEQRITGTLGDPGGPDGYEILRSETGDFSSDLAVIRIPNVNQSTYVDSIGGAPRTFSYRIHATAGTLSQPHSVHGMDTGSVRATSLDANDTTTTPVTVRDNYTSDRTRSERRSGTFRPNLE